MREILFRGKWTRNKQWVYGYVTHFKQSDWNIYEDNTGKLYQVDTDTVSQYTGLKDKNGKRIFEGDVLCYFSNNRPVKVEWWSEEGKFIGVGNGCLDGANFKEWHIIGNIYDNPELMEESNE